METGQQNLNFKYLLIKNRENRQWMQSKNSLILAYYKFVTQIGNVKIYN
jgi:hypothetical protein